MNKENFENEFGGFNQSGNEYHITHSKHNPTPRPWTNVIANPNFGTIVSESSLGMTWFENSKDKRITSWSNDWVIDKPSEIIYIKDLESNEIWSATPNPLIKKYNSKEIKFKTVHGLGYSKFENEIAQIKSELTVFVDLIDPIKILDLKLKNQSSSKRKIALYYYLDIVMGSYQNQFDNFINYEESIDQNLVKFFRTDKPNFQSKIFVTSSEKIQSWTSNKNLFVGYLGSLANPDGLKNPKLENQIGIPNENCLVIQIEIELQPFEENNISFLLGCAKGENQIDQFLQKYLKRDAIDKSLFEVSDYWKTLNSKIKIKTPDQSMDLLFNNWLLYQILSCRVWGRSSFYQSSGAFGFRDQLQDVLAFLNVNSDITRDQILLAAKRQYLEGDVQHWWFEDSSIGVRNKVSDSAAWLAYITATYIDRTGDYSILDLQIPYLEGRPLTADEPAYVEVPKVSDISESLFEHCLKAIKHVSDFGVHGIPLMKEGDWNDGMNLIGKKDIGESVWLGWFLVKVLKQFIEIATRLGNENLRKELEINLQNLTRSLQSTAWDGEWYLRAFSDDGQKLGSASSVECKIDSISQSWSVIADIDDLQRQNQAMDSALKNLVDRENEIVSLIQPAFDQAPLNPGYIKDYPPGIRENGGQYSHAVFWFITALIKLEKFDDAYQLLSFTNPIYRTSTNERISKYKTEPYAVCGDIYSAVEHIGKGGWSWYTGSAGLMYSTILEQILGFKKCGTILKIIPGAPKDWQSQSFEINYQYKTSIYNIKVSFLSNHNNKVKKVSIDSIESQMQDFAIELVDDGKPHEVIVEVE